MRQWPCGNDVFIELPIFKRNGELDFHVHRCLQQIPLKKSMGQHHKGPNQNHPISKMTPLLFAISSSGTESDQKS